MYTYQATVLRWVDGDTVQLRVDLGFAINVTLKFRLLGVDTPERGTLNYVEAKNCSESVLPVGTVLTITTHKLTKTRYFNITARGHSQLGDAVHHQAERFKNARTRFCYVNID